MVKNPTSRKVITFVASFASILGLLVGGFQVGLWAADSNAEKVVVEVESRLTHIVSSLPTEKQTEAERVLGPLLTLVSAAEADDSEALEQATNEVTEVLDRSLLAYKASASPFVPPMNKVQFLCDDRFQLTYVRSYQRSSVFLVGLPDEIPSFRTMTPGAVEIVEFDRERLSLTLLEHREDLGGPLLKYTCRV
ncbi:MAG: hypothetical protein AAGC60_05435 [Acidobacteriota bacterium]